MDKKNIFDIGKRIEEIELPSWMEKTWEVLKAIGRVLASIGKWIFRLRGFFMAIPVALAALLV